MMPAKSCVTAYMPTSFQGRFPLMPRATETAGLKLAPETPPKAKIATIKTHAMEVPAQTPLFERTLQPMVKINRKVPVNSAMSFPDIGTSCLAMLQKSEIRDHFVRVGVCNTLR